jgi:zinc transport system substrate-binding protein
MQKLTTGTHPIKQVSLAIGLLAANSVSPSASAAELRVVVTIKPIHALVSQVMGDTGKPSVLVAGAASPHTYALKPSDARMLNEADIVFRVSEALEPFMAKAVRSFSKSVTVVTLEKAPGMKLLARRSGNTFEKESRGKGHGHDHDSEGFIDGHSWLDPDNAKAMTDRIAEALAAKAPDQAATFKANAAALNAKIETLANELAIELKPIGDRPYVVFHDAYQYLERRYHMNVVGSITISPEIPASGKRLGEIRKKIASLDAACVFSEPNFDAKVVQPVIEGSKARAGVLDPEGATLEPGPDLYFQLMRKLARDLKSCLAEAS